MFHISTRVTYPEQRRDAVVEFGRAMRTVLERQPGLVRVEYLETCAHTATEMRACWQSESDFEAWSSSDDHRALFSAPDAFDFAGCEFSSETFEAL